MWRSCHEPRHVPLPAPDDDAPVMQTQERVSRGDYHLAVLNGHRALTDEPLGLAPGLGPARLDDGVHHRNAHILYLLSSHSTISFVRQSGPRSVTIALALSKSDLRDETADSSCLILAKRPSAIPFLNPSRYPRLWSMWCAPFVVSSKFSIRLSVLTPFL